jgi:ABC-2 type transport system ATP-binding protein
VNAIEVSGLTRRYGRVEALGGADLSVGRGEVFGLVGPNGAGKTTLIKGLLGALRPSSGTARVMGLNPLEDRAELRQRIGYMPQGAALYEDLSARDNVGFFGAAHRTPDLKKKVDEIIHFSELSGRAEDPVHTFSGGMKRRVWLACGRGRRPEVIFLDEPTSAVDPQLRSRFWRTFRELAGDGATLLRAT